MPSKTKQQINKEFFEKKKDEVQICLECKIPVKYQSRVKHMLSKKHIENCKKTRSHFLDDYHAIHDKLGEPKAKITDLFREMYYLIQSEYFDEDDIEIPDDSEKWIQPKTNNDKEAAFVQQSAFIMFETISELFDDKISNVDTNTEAYALEELEEQFKQINLEDNDAKVKMMRFYRGLQTKQSSDVVDETTTAGIISVKKEEEEEEEEEEDEEEQEEEQEEEEEEEENNGIETYFIDETNWTTSHFPQIMDFRRLTKKTKERVLEEIAVNCSHVFDDERYLIDNIYAVLTEQEKLQYDIIYDDVYSCYKRFQYNNRIIEDDDEQQQTNILNWNNTEDDNENNEDETLDYDFKY